MASRSCSLFLAAICAVGCATVGEPRSFQATVAGSGRAVVLIPDLQASGAVWETTVAHLGGRAQTHVLDVAGFAGQPPVEGPLLRKLHDELARYIRDRGLQRPVLVGHMFGATVAYWLAMTDPELVGGVVAIDAPPSRPTGDPEDAAESEQIRRSLLSATPAAFAAMVRRRVATMVADPARARELGDAAARSSQKAVAEAFYEMATLDLSAEIPKIRAPVLVLLSTENVPKESWSAYEQRFRDQLSPVRAHEIVVLKGTRHYVMFDDPVEFFRRLDGFLATH
jgi:pimeloyl-ACP methyl ester carboxylesterase